MLSRLDRVFNSRLILKMKKVVTKDNRQKAWGSFSDDFF